MIVAYTAAEHDRVIAQLKERDLQARDDIIVIDATNRAVKEDAAQGLATWDDYSSEIEEIFTNGKFGQLLVDHRPHQVTRRLELPESRHKDDVHPLNLHHSGASPHSQVNRLEGNGFSNPVVGAIVQCALVNSPI